MLQCELPFADEVSALVRSLKDRMPQLRQRPPQAQWPRPVPATQRGLAMCLQRICCCGQRQPICPESTLQSARLCHGRRDGRRRMPRGPAAEFGRDTARRRGGSPDHNAVTPGTEVPERVTVGPNEPMA